MHPSRAVSLAYLCLGALVVVWGAITVAEQITFGGALLLVGGAMLLGATLYRLARDESSPIVTEYGPLTYALLGGATLFALGIVVQLL